MKHDLAWIAVEGVTHLLTLSVVVMALATLLTAFDIGSVFNQWFDSWYVPALLTMTLLALRFLSRFAADYLLHLDDDEDAAGLT